MINYNSLTYLRYDVKGQIEDAPANPKWQITGGSSSGIFKIKRAASYNTAYWSDGFDINLTINGLLPLEGTETKVKIVLKNAITGVEIDAAVIELARKYFGLGNYNNVSIVNDDAFEFVLKTKEKYDLIIIDIFQDTTMPNFLFEDFFINRINFLLNVNGFILFNTMILDYQDRRRNVDYKNKFDSNYSVRLYPKIEVHNELFTIKKLS